MQYAAIALTLLFAAYSASAQDSHASRARIDTLMFESANRSLISLDYRDNVAVILASGYSCRKCFSTLEQALRSIDSTTKIYVAISTTSTSALERRLHSEDYFNLVRSRNFLYDYNPRGLGDSLGEHRAGVMHRFNVRITPCVILSDRKAGFIYLDYSDLFGTDIDSDAGVESVVRAVRTALSAP